MDPENNEQETLGFTTKALIFLAGTLLTVFLGVFCYYLVKFSVQYLRTRAFRPRLEFLNEGGLKVGETISGKLSFLGIRANGLEAPCDPTQLLEISKNLSFGFYNYNGTRKSEIGVSVLKEFTTEKDALLVKCSLRRSGPYDLYLWYGRFQFISCPLKFEVLPGPISLKNVTLDLNNPELLTVAVETWREIRILPRDRYGNVCLMDQGLVPNFRLRVKRGRDIIEPTSELDWEFYHNGDDFYIKIKAKIVDVIKCKIMAPMMEDCYLASFLLNSMSLQEFERFNYAITSMFSPLPGSCEGTLMSIGPAVQDPSHVYITINYDEIKISAKTCGIIYYPFLAFYINRRTNVAVIDAPDANGNFGTITLRIFDHIQNAITLDLTASNARTFLASFGYFKGSKLGKMSYKDKKEALRVKVKDHLGRFLPRYALKMIPWSTLNPYVIQLESQSNECVTSSRVKWPTSSKDWLRPTLINIKLPGALKILPIDKALNLFLEHLFNNKPDGLFRTYPSSSRLHPNMKGRKRSSWSEEDMEFAGSILGKCIHDPMRFGTCLNTSKLLFSKTFLASLIGLPTTYDFFESDYPNFYRKYVQPVVQSDLEEYPLKFQIQLSPERNWGRSDSEVEVNLNQINLVPGGDRIPVTRGNKFEYLNLLATHVLKAPIADEISTFQIGLYKVIPQTILSDFDVDELENLISGGDFSLENLKKGQNHRVVANILTLGSNTTLPSQTGMSPAEQKTLLTWFWTSLSNFSEEETRRFLRLSTGAASVPSCGFKELTPKFTISLTGGENEGPKYFPCQNTICIGGHESFEGFENAFIKSLYEPWELEIL